MILQALNRYYERKQHTGELACEGFERKEIPFVIVLDAHGKVRQIDDTRHGQGKQKTARSFLVPQAAKKSVNVAANLLWGNAEYVLGIPDPKKLEENRKKGTEARYYERLGEMQRAFGELIRARLGSALDDAGIAAVQAFVASPDLDGLAQEPVWAEIAQTNPNLAFRLDSDMPDVLVCNRNAVSTSLHAGAEQPAEAELGFCPVGGKFDHLQRLHPAIKGVWGAQTSGANIVSFNLPAFDSYGKKQGANAPTGEQAAFQYTTALNHLLRKGSTNRIQIGDASTVFWASEASAFADSFAAMFGVTGQDDPDSGVQAVRALLRATETGAYVPDDGDARFYVLGLAPNAARIAVRFWQQGPVREFALHVARHFKDIEIVAPGFEKPYLPLYRLLNSTALQNKGENVPPDMAGDTMRAILAGLPYPAALLQAAVRRCRAERQVNYPRAAVTKAAINRLVRHQQFNAKELEMSLDRSNTDPGYRLGRLFSALERVQSAAQPGINATIRDRYYGAASSSPASVFPVLLRLKNHHLAKLDGGLSTWYEKLFGEIVSGISAFPSQLNLKEQGLFAIGYYHQQQDFFTGKTKPAPTTDSNAGEN